MKPNGSYKRKPGTFRPGFDPRRRRGFSPAECSRGFRVTVERHGDRLGLWLLIRLKQTCPLERSRCR